LKNPSSVSVVGTDYVGLCTAANFASRGIRTIGIDIDVAKIEQIRKGRATLHEPQLGEMLRSVVKKRLLHASTDVSRTTDTTTSFLTVGTPSKPDGSIDLTWRQAGY